MEKPDNQPTVGVPIEHQPSIIPWNMPQDSALALPKAPPVSGEQQVPELPAPKLKALHVLVAITAALFVVEIILPPSAFAQGLAWPFAILGAATGISFIGNSVTGSMRYSPVVRVFMVLGSIGMGLIIFGFCVIGGLIFGFTKDPNPQSTG